MNIGNSTEDTVGIVWAVRATTHYLSRELEIKDKLEEEYSIVDNNFISNIVDDIIFNVVNSFNNNNFIDPDVSNLAEDEGDGGDIEVDSLYLPVTCSDPLLPIPPEPPPNQIKNEFN